MTAARLTRLRAEARDAGVCAACWIDAALMGRVLTGETALPVGPLVVCPDGWDRCAAHARRWRETDAAARRARYCRAESVQAGLALAAQVRAVVRAERRPPRRARWICGGCGYSGAARTHGGAWGRRCPGCGETMAWEAA